MFVRRFQRGAREDTRKPDERLSALLREWKGIEPHPGFEAAVWRRILAATVPRRRAILPATAARVWAPLRPVWATAMGTAVAVLAGAWAGLALPAPHGGRGAPEPLLHASTLSGSYLALVTGGTR